MYLHYGSKILDSYIGGSLIFNIDGGTVVDIVVGVSRGVIV